MSDLPDIIKTDIITNKSDSFWMDSFGKLKGLDQRPVVVISAPFQTGSAEETQLLKMLQACQLTEQDYHIIQLHEQEVIAWHLLRDHLHPKQIILLGISGEQLGIAVHFMPHQVSRFNDRSWVATSSLQDLLGHDDIKKHVWNYGLKPVFIDKIYG